MDDSNVTYGTIEFHQTENKLLKATARIASLETQLEEARGIIEVVVEVKDDDCYYDHHGYCQAHNLEEDCHVAKAKNFIEQYMKDEV